MDSTSFSMQNRKQLSTIFTDFPKLSYQFSEGLRGVRVNVLFRRIARWQ
jgi:hypothetical protein